MKKTLASLGVIALVALGATGVPFPATAAATAQPVVEIVTEPDAIIASPDAVLKQAEPVVAAVAAPVTPVVPVEAPVAPVPVVVPVRVVVAPVASEPVPVAPAVDPYSGNPIVDCEALGLITAEDYSCVNPTFYAPEPVPAICGSLKLGDAWAGVSLVCGTTKAEPTLKGVEVEGPVTIPAHAEPGPKS